MNLRGIYFEKEPKRFYPKRELAAHAWPQGAAVRVRMGLHTGTAEILPDGKY